MSLRGGSIGCQVEEFHEIAVYVHVVSYLETRIRVVNTRTFKERPVPHDLRLGVIHARRQTFRRYLSAVHVLRERTQIVVAEIIGFRRHGVQKFHVLHYGECVVLGRFPTWSCQWKAIAFR